jgi:hypothetical protein
VNHGNRLQQPRIVAVGGKRGLDGLAASILVIDLVGAAQRARAIPAARYRAAAAK